MKGRECTAQVAFDRIKDDSSPVTGWEAEYLDTNAKETAGFDNGRGKLFSHLIVPIFSKNHKMMLAAQVVGRCLGGFTRKKS